MRLHRYHVVLAALLAAGCGAAPQFGDRMVAQVTQLSQAERAAALLEQPALHARMTIRWHELLKSKAPVMKDQIDRMNRRSIALNRLELRAAHALAYRDFKDKMLEEVGNLMTRWLADPGPYLVMMERILTAIEGQPVEKVAAMARELPAIFIKSEDPLDMAPAAAVSGPSEYESLLKAAVADLAEKATVENKAALAKARDKVLALSKDQLRGLQASFWQEFKGKTIAEVSSLKADWMEDPGRAAAMLIKHADRVAGLSKQGLASLSESYPAALSEIRDALIMAPNLATKAN